MKFKFKKNVKVSIGTEDPWYALSYGGYLDPADVLSDKRQVKAVKDATAIVCDFLDQCREAEAIEEA
jgi:hypothetical protein